MGLEQREFAVVSPTEDRVALGDLPRLVLYKTDGTPYQETPFTPAATQAVFAGADVTALKVELNAFLTKLKDAGIVASS